WRKPLITSCSECRGSSPRRRAQTYCTTKGHLMTEAIVWGLVWLILTFGITWLIYVLVGLVGVALAAATETIWIAPLAALVGWLTALMWFIFGAVRTVQQIISIVELAAAG